MAFLALADKLQRYTAGTKARLAGLAHRTIAFICLP
jgi:hypothetical protein